MGIVPMESFQQFMSEWEDLLQASPVNSIYLTPQWQQVWWDYYGIDPIHIRSYQSHFDPL